MGLEIDEFFVHGRFSKSLETDEGEGEADAWGPHVNQWRERETTGMFWSIRKIRTSLRPDSGPRYSEDVDNSKDHLEEKL